MGWVQARTKLLKNLKSFNGTEVEGDNCNLLHKEFVAIWSSFLLPSRIISLPNLQLPKRHDTFCLSTHKAILAHKFDKTNNIFQQAWVVRGFIAEGRLFQESEYNPTIFFLNNSTHHHIFVCTFRKLEPWILLHKCWWPLEDHRSSFNQNPSS